MLDPFYADVVRDLGPPQRCIALTSEQDARLSNCLPESFMEFLRTFGFGDYFNRSLQYCDPATFSSILALIFKADPDFSHQDCYVVAYTAFGELICWSRRQDHFRIDLTALQLSSSKLAPTNFVKPYEGGSIKRSLDANVLSRNLLPSRPDNFDMFDADDEPLFDRCVERHGALDRGECYGFFPALALTGFNPSMARIENIKRVRALEHFAILAQLGTVHLMRLQRGYFESVRPIG